MQTRTMYLTTALLLSLGAIEPSADSRRSLSDALEQALPSLTSNQDYRVVSEISPQLTRDGNRLGAVEVPKD